QRASLKAMSFENTGPRRSQTTWQPSRSAAHDLSAALRQDTGLLDSVLDPGSPATAFPGWSGALGSAVHATGDVSPLVQLAQARGESGAQVPLRGTSEGESQGRLLGVDGGEDGRGDSSGIDERFSGQLAELWTARTLRS
ncbi:hypothetical protein QMK19_41350, partial [Streptomyces sp. H10-C2]|uniref:hypothetical protein n=1 Tax=unclassified Streptomyces TaxID=2593676 RepID=UPI0024BB1A88